MLNELVAGAFAVHAFCRMCLNFRDQLTHTGNCLLVGVVFSAALVLLMHGFGASQRVLLPAILFVGLWTERVFCTFNDTEPDALASKRFLVLTVFTSSFCTYALWLLVQWIEQPQLIGDGNK